VSICYDNLAALKALRAVRTTSRLVYQCQRALNDISARHAVGLFWVPGHVGIRGNEIADGFASCGSALSFFGPETALGVSRRDLQTSLGRWLVNQHGAFGEVLVTPKGRPASLSQVPVWAPGQNL